MPVKYVKRDESVEGNKPLTDEQLKRRIKNALSRKCPDCGQRMTLTATRRYCPQCDFKHNEVWTLNEKTWKWSKEDRGNNGG